MIFKDQLPARTFQLPLRWIPWLSTTITLGVIALLGTALFSVQQSLIVHRLRNQLGHAPQPSPAELNELTQLRQEVEKLRSAAVVALANAPAANASQPATQPSAMSDSPDLPAISAPFGGTLNTQTENGAKEDTKIVLNNIQTTFKNNRWSIKFNIQYKLDDGGFQQGRFTLVARGPGAVLAWPKPVFQFQKGNQPLVDLGKGETFSVARFREVKADFGVIEGQEGLKELLIFLIDPQGKLLMQKTVPLKS